MRERPDVPPSVTTNGAREPRLGRGRGASLGLIVRGTAGGSLMGLANLVPGISGGTMLLATGVYPRFVNAVAEISTLRFRFSSLLLLGVVLASAATTVLFCAGPVKNVVVLHAALAFSLFIGLTLGGVPVIWRMLPAASRSVWLGAAGGLVAMSTLSLLQHLGMGARSDGETTVFLLAAAGAGGAAAMVLPGVSGGYILLVLGQYVPILSAIEDLRVAVSTADTQAALGPAVTVLLPFAAGIALGIVLVSNMVRYVFERFPGATLGTLLGLLLGAVIGLWPFRRTVEPLASGVPSASPSQLEPGSLQAETLLQEFYWPAPFEALLATSFILLGFAITTAVAWLGSRLEDETIGTPHIERDHET